MFSKNRPGSGVKILPVDAPIIYGQSSDVVHMCHVGIKINLRCNQ